MTKLGQMVGAPGGVLCPYLDTRPVVGSTLKVSADQPFGRPWAKDRTQVSAARGVLWPDLATRPAVGEHVMGEVRTNLQTGRWTRLGRGLMRYASFSAST